MINLDALPIITPNDEYPYIAEAYSHIDKYGTVWHYRHVKTSENDGFFTGFFQSDAEALAEAERQVAKIKKG